MRLWSGADVSFGKDHLGPGVIVSGPPGFTTRLPGDAWRLDVEAPDGRRIWRPTSAEELGRVHAPVPDELAGLFAKRLEQADAAASHPALTDGLAGEAARLHPALDPSMVEAFEGFVSYLVDELDLPANPEDRSVPFVDGFGPELLLMLDGQPVPLPEVPPVYMAPEAWRRSSWAVANTMVGPDLSEGLELDERLRFRGPAPPEEPGFEGLVYYEAARSMVAWAAWEGDPTGRFVGAVLEAVMAGARPWARRDHS